MLCFIVWYILLGHGAAIFYKLLYYIGHIKLGAKKALYRWIFAATHYHILNLIRVAHLVLLRAWLVCFQNCQNFGKPILGLLFCLLPKFTHISHLCYQNVGKILMLPTSHSLIFFCASLSFASWIICFVEEIKAVTLRVKPHIKDKIILWMSSII